MHFVLFLIQGQVDGWTETLFMENLKKKKYLEHVANNNYTLTINHNQSL